MRLRQCTAKSESSENFPDLRTWLVVGVVDQVIEDYLGSVRRERLKKEGAFS